MSRITRMRASGVIVSAARQNRHTLTPAEQALWEALRDRRFHGLKFRKQHPVGNYVLDFYCLQEKLIVEVDGSIHDDPEQRELDEERTQRLNQEGNRVLRFFKQRCSEASPRRPGSNLFFLDTTPYSQFTGPINQLFPAHLEPPYMTIVMPSPRSARSPELAREKHEGQALLPIDYVG